LVKAYFSLLFYIKNMDKQAFLAERDKFISRRREIEISRERKIIHLCVHDTFSHQLCKEKICIFVCVSS
jgi:hypothetical protein